MIDLKPVEELLGHEFADKGILSAALTHSSLSKQTRRGKVCSSYERLEFLGDRVLGLVVADMLHRRFPNEQEGDLSKRMHVLVSGKTLADVGRSLSLMEHLKTAPGEFQTDALDNISLLSDTMEAVIAALYVDGGLSAARAFIEPIWDPLIESETVPPKDAKSALQERTQALRLGLPIYKVIDRTGPDHNPAFVVHVEVRGQNQVEGRGKSRREAEQAAAATMLEALA